MVCIERNGTAAISCAASHVTIKERYKFTSRGGYSKCTIKSYSHSFRITCDKSAVLLFMGGE